VARPSAWSCARVAALGGASLLAVATPAGSGADPAAGARSNAARLRSENSALAQQRQRAVLELYALESQLARARSRLAGLQLQAARVRAAQALVRRELVITRHVLAVTQRRLAERLRTLYEQGDVDPLAILLGSQSLDEALTSIDALQRVSAQSEHVIHETQSTRARLDRLNGRLVARSGELAALERDAEQAAASLAASREQRLGLIATLRTRERLNDATIASLDATARAAEARSARIIATTSVTAALSVADPAPAEPLQTPAAAVAPGAQTITVVATGYSTQGHTATGVPTGWGVAAVDPGVIPLGTRFDVPGYGLAVAADTGGAVHGATVDLWFPTQAQALGWGRRTVTVTLH
jgi:3D (Asp-Asp-Asp) domain-containing protein